MVIGSPLRGFRSILAICLLVGPCAGVSAQTVDPRAEFSAAYAAYQAAIDAGDAESALAAARRAYELGAAYFGRENANTAALALNYGNLLIRTDPDAAVEVLGEADRIYAELHGPESLDRVETQLALAEAQRRYEDKHAAINRAAAMYRSSAPDDRLGYAELLFTAGAMLAGAKPGSPEAKALLEEALEVFEGELGRNAPQLIPTLIELGNLSGVPRLGNPEQTAYYRRAVRIGESSLDDVAAADVKLRIGLELVRQPVAQETVPYLDQAHRAYEKRLGAGHPKTALASLALAEALFGSGDAKRARARVDAALDFYESTQDRTNLLRAQRLLMAIHLHNGDEDLFNDALMEVGRLSEGFSSPDNEVPVVKYAPVYPARAAAAKAGGYVIVEFTVDETGRVEVPIVVESYSDKGKGEWFHDAALEAVRKFRYIPRYVDGVPTSTPGVRNRITFVIE